MYYNNNGFGKNNIYSVNIWKCDYCSSSNLKLRVNFPFGRKSKPRRSIWCLNCGEYQPKSVILDERIRRKRIKENKRLQYMLRKDMKEKAIKEGRVNEKEEKYEKGKKKHKHL